MTPADHTDDAELPPWQGARLRDDLHRLFRRETGPDANDFEEPAHD